MSCATCHVSRVTGHDYLFQLLLFLDKVVQLVGGGSVINGATPSILLSLLLQTNEKVMMLF